MNITESIKSLSAKGCYKSAKKWWKSLTPDQKAIAIGILVACIATPLLIAYAKNMAVTKVTVLAANQAGTEGIIHIVQVAAPLWHKILFVSMWSTMTFGFSAGLASAYYDDK
jgi:hypothetical protein